MSFSSKFRKTDPLLDRLSATVDKQNFNIDANFATRSNAELFPGTHKGHTIRERDPYQATKNARFHEMACTTGQKLSAETRPNAIEDYEHLRVGAQHPINAPSSANSEAPQPETLGSFPYTPQVQRLQNSWNIMHDNATQMQRHTAANDFRRAKLAAVTRSGIEFNYSNPVPRGAVLRNDTYQADPFSGAADVPHQTKRVDTANDTQVAYLASVAEEAALFRRTKNPGDAHPAPRSFDIAAPERFIDNTKPPRDKDWSVFRTAKSATSAGKAPQ